MKCCKCKKEATMKVMGDDYCEKCGTEWQALCNKAYNNIIAEQEAEYQNIRDIEEEKGL